MELFLRKKYIENCEQKDKKTYSKDKLAIVSSVSILWVSQKRYQFLGEKKWTHEIEAKYARQSKMASKSWNRMAVQNGYYFMYNTWIVSVLLHLTQ